MHNTACIKFACACARRFLYVYVRMYGGPMDRQLEIRTYATVKCMYVSHPSTGGSIVIPTYRTDDGSWIPRLLQRTWISWILHWAGRASSGPVGTYTPRPILQTLGIGRPGLDQATSSIQLTARLPRPSAKRASCTVRTRCDGDLDRSAVGAGPDSARAPMKPTGGWREVRTWSGRA